MYCTHLAINHLQPECVSTNLTKRLPTQGQERLEDRVLLNSPVLLFEQFAGIRQFFRFIPFRTCTRTKAQTSPKCRSTSFLLLVAEARILLAMTAGVGWVVMFVGFGVGAEVVGEASGGSGSGSGGEGSIFVNALSCL